MDTIEAASLVVAGASASARGLAELSILIPAPRASTASGAGRD